MCKTPTVSKVVRELEKIILYLSLINHAVILRTVFSDILSSCTMSQENTGYPPGDGGGGWGGYPPSGGGGDGVWGGAPRSYENSQAVNPDNFLLNTYGYFL